MTLFAWVKDLEDTIKEFRTTGMIISSLYVSWAGAILNRQYVTLYSWPWAYAFYGLSGRKYTSLPIESVAPSYALLVTFVRLGKVLLRYKMRRMRKYRESMMYFGAPRESVLDLDGLVKLHDQGGASSYIVLSLSDEGYLSIRETKSIRDMESKTPPGSIIPPRLLPQLLL